MKYLCTKIATCVKNAIVLGKFDSILSTGRVQPRHVAVCIYFKNSTSSTEVACRHSWLPAPSTLVQPCVPVAKAPFISFFFAKYYDIEWLLPDIGYKRT